MKIEIKPTHQGTLITSLIEVRNQIIYITTEVIPNISNMAAWEADEYTEVLNSYKKDLETIKKQILSNEAVFNEMLAEYNYTAATFIVAVQNSETKIILK